MTAALGYLALAVGAAGAALGIVAILSGLRRGGPRSIMFGRRAVAVVLVAAIAAVATMEWALLTNDFSIRYVAENHARATPLLFTITGLWASLEGSILLWALVLAGYLAVMVFTTRARRNDPLVAWAIVVGLGVALFFFALMLGPANPFRVVSGLTPADGAGPNPLLQNHPLMAFHPPILYLGYVGFTVPFCFAIASLVTGRLDEGWIASTRRTTLVAWTFLTIGVVLGAWWSYEVLGWGGFWAWDPVENASLMPWLAGTAFLHSVMVQERRGMLRVWNLSLVIATFCLTILGTFLTRSGIVDSVHAFTQSAIGPWLLTFLVATAALGIGLIAWRGDRLRAPGRIDSPVSREAAFLANNLLFAAFAFVVLLGTTFPLLAEAIDDRRLSVGRPYFDRMTTPLGLALLFLMAVAPALPWRAASGELIRHRLVIPAWIGAGAMVLTVVFLGGGPALVATFGLASFAASAIGREFVVAVRARRRADASALPRAAFGTVRANPRRWGGLTVHLGIVFIATAIAAFGSFGTREEVRLREGESATVAGYQLTYLGSSVSKTDQRTQVAARVEIERGGRNLGVYTPAISSFPNATAGIATPSVRTGILTDVYLTLISSPNQQGRITLSVGINPLVVWLWIGGGVIAIGAALALTPGRRSTLVATSEPEPEREEVLV